MPFAEGVCVSVPTFGSKRPPTLSDAPLPALAPRPLRTAAPMPAPPPAPEPVPASEPPAVEPPPATPLTLSQFQATLAGLMLERTIDRGGLRWELRMLDDDEEANVLRLAKLRKPEGSSVEEWLGTVEGTSVFRRLRLASAIRSLGNAEGMLTRANDLFPGVDATLAMDEVLAKGPGVLVTSLLDVLNELEREHIRRLNGIGPFSNPSNPTPPASV